MGIRTVDIGIYILGCLHQISMIQCFELSASLQLSVPQFWVVCIKHIFYVSILGCSQQFMEPPSPTQEKLTGSLTKLLLNITKGAIVGTNNLAKPSRQWMRLLIAFYQNIVGSTRE